MNPRPIFYRKADNDFIDLSPFKVIRALETNEEGLVVIIGFFSLHVPAVGTPIDDMDGYHVITWCLPEETEEVLANIIQTTKE